MSKHIDADWLKDNLYRRCSNEMKRNGYPEEYGLIDFIEMLNYAPAVDVVEVVRCKDCKHRYVGGYTTLYYVCDFMDAELKDEGYCSYGERKNG